MKIIAILVILLSLNTCKLSLQESTVKNPQEKTTVEMINNTDTVIITHTNKGDFYIMEDGLIKYHLIPTNEESILVPRDLFRLLLFTFILSIFILILLLIFGDFQ